MAPAPVRDAAAPRPVPQNRQSFAREFYSSARASISASARVCVQRPVVLGNLEQCNGCGGCLKQSGIMCPTFIATHDEVMSTRGRANIIRAALELRTNGHDPLKSAELDAALSNCLSCKGCTPECPSNVNLALLKAEMLHARWRRDGLPLRERILSNVDLLGKLGCLMPRLTNRLLGSKAARIAMEKTIGISARRSLPHYASERFDKWFANML